MKKTLAIPVLIALVGAASLVAQTPDKKPAPADQAKQFVGTWKAKLGDKTFAVLALQLENGRLTGKLRSGSIHVDANGEVDRVDREASSESTILDLSVAGGVLSFRNKDGEDVDSYEMKLTGENESALKLLPTGAGSADVSALKPFRMTREIKK